MEAVPDHQQDGQQQDADVGEVVGADLHGDRLASNGAPAGGQSCPDKQSLEDRVDHPVNFTFSTIKTGTKVLP